MTTVTLSSVTVDPVIFASIKKATTPIWVFVALALFACTNLAARPVSPHAQKAVETIQQLRAIGLPNSNDLESGPPAKVPALLRLLNQELKALIVEDLNDTNRHIVPGDEEIMDQLIAAGWEEIPSHKWNAYGEIRQIKFAWEPGYEPGILIVSTQLWLPCGSTDPDSAVYVFQGIARHWDLVLATESDFNLSGENDGTGMQYELSPADSSGRWFLVVAHVPPSCRRSPDVLRYKALRPGANANEPTLLVSGRESIDSFFQPPFQIRTESDWFAVTHGKVRKLDGELGIAISRYDLSGPSSRRIAPLALTPENFLDQWAQLSWDDAKRWTKASSDSSLQDWHSKLNSLTYASTEIESVRHCSGTDDSDQTWLIELSIDQRVNPAIKQETLYVDVARRGGNFLLEGVHESHPSECPGETALNLVIDHSLPSW
jgi:hypothetical protein